MSDVNNVGQQPSMFKRVFDRLSNYWKKEELVNPSTSENVQNSVPDGEKTPPTADSINAQINEASPFYWIENEGLLRDEGVLFGISGADMEEKLAAIQNYYKQKQAPYEAQQQLIEVSLSETREEYIKVKQKLEDNKSQLGNWDLLKGGNNDHKFARHFFGLLVLSLAVVGCFFLVRNFASPIYGDWATAGIFMFGLFASIAPISSWLALEEERQLGFGQKARNALLEVGTPVAATILIGYLIYRKNESIGESLAVGVFVLFLFFFCGKLTLALFQLLVKDSRIIALNRKERKQRKMEYSLLEKDISEQMQLVETLQGKIQEYLSKQADNNKHIQEINQRMKTKVEVFRSEYNLATSLKNSVVNDKNELLDVK